MSTLQLPPNTTLEPTTATRLTTTTSTAYSIVLSRFRNLVPPFPKGLLDGSTKDRSTFEATTNTAIGPQGFVLFHEFNHGSWIRVFSDPCTVNPGGDNGPNKGLGLHRLIFGNPLIAITMIREDVEAGLYVPIEMLLVELDGGGTKCVAQLPSGLIAGHKGGNENQKLVEAVAFLDGKLMDLIGDLMK